MNCYPLVSFESLFLLPLICLPYPVLCWSRSSNENLPIPHLSIFHKERPFLTCVEESLPVFFFFRTLPPLWHARLSYLGLQAFQRIETTQYFLCLPARVCPIGQASAFRKVWKRNPPCLLGKMMPQKDPNVPRTNPPSKMRTMTRT